MDLLQEYQNKLPKNFLASIQIVISFAPEEARNMAQTHPTKPTLENDFEIHTNKIETLGQLAAGMAHDFNNILGLILFHCERTIENLPGDSREVKRSVEVIQKASDRAASITKQFLRFYRTRELILGSFDLNELITETVAFLEPLFGKSIPIQTTLTPKLGTIYGCADLMKQAILNLALNARDAMPDSGILLFQTLQVAHPEASVLFVIKDTGHGMDQETKSRIFEAYFTTKGEKGTGLGLSIVKKAIEECHGKIEVESADGKGTEFRIFLPQSEFRH